MPLHAHREAAFNGTWSTFTLSHAAIRPTRRSPRSSGPQGSGQQPGWGECAVDGGRIGGDTLP